MSIAQEQGSAFSPYEGLDTEDRAEVMRLEGQLELNVEEAILDDPSELVFALRPDEIQSLTNPANPERHEKAITVFRTMLGSNNKDFYEFVNQNHETVRLSYLKHEIDHIDFQREKAAEIVIDYASTAKSLKADIQDITEEMDLDPATLRRLADGTTVERAEIIESIKQTHLERLREPVYEWLENVVPAAEVKSLEKEPFREQTRQLKLLEIRRKQEEARLAEQKLQNELEAFQKSDARSWMNEILSPEEIKKIEAQAPEKRVAVYREVLNAYAEEKQHEEKDQPEDVSPQKIPTSSEASSPEKPAALAEAKKSPVVSSPDTLPVDISSIKDKKYAVHAARIDGHTVIVFKGSPLGLLQDGKTVAENALAQTIEKVQELPRNTVIIGASTLALAGGTVAMNTLSSNPLGVDSESAMIAEAGEAAEALFGSAPSQDLIESSGLSPAAAETAAGRVILNAAQNLDIETAEKAKKILKLSPLTVAEQQGLDYEHAIAPKDRKEYIASASKYMDGLLALAEKVGSIEEHGADDENSRQAISRISQFASFGLNRLNESGADITPQELNAIAEQLTNAILAAKHPRAAEIIWPGQKYEAGFEETLGKHLMTTMFSKDTKTYTEEQQKIITSFLASGIALSVSGDEAVAQALAESIETSANIAENNKLSSKGSKTKRLTMKNFLPKPNSPENRVYRFYRKNGFSPAASAGAVGNFSVESAGFRVINGYGGGDLNGNGSGDYFGMAQWDPARAARLRMFAQTNGLNFRRMNTQLKFTIHELNNDEKAARFYIKRAGESAAQKAANWGRYYERALTNGALQMESERRIRAQAYMNHVLAELRRKNSGARAEISGKNQEAWRKKVTDLGVQDTYINGELVRQRLFAVDGLPSLGQESTPGSDYYIARANGRAIVSEKIAAQTVDLVERAKKQGIRLIVASSFRTDPHQRVLAARNPDRNEVAEPGHSSHQSGEALDFVLDGLQLSASLFPAMNGGTPSVNNPRIAPQSQTWRFLSKNVRKSDLRIFWNEPWHVSRTGF